MKKVFLIASSCILIYCLYAVTPESTKSVASAPLSMNQQIKDTKTVPHIATFTLNCDIDVQKTMDDLFTAAHDESVHALALYINHPGGECGPYSALHDLIKAIRKKKPVVALITGHAYSAGYMIASATDYIICASGAGIGAIGTIWEIHKYSDATVRCDGHEATDTVEVFIAGKYKGVENPLTAPLTPKTRKHLQAIVDENYQYFLKLVATNRNLSLQTSDQWADGKEFMAEKALALGLIDQIGTLFDVEQKVLEMVRVAKPDIDWAQNVTFEKYVTNDTEQLSKNEGKNS